MDEMNMGSGVENGGTPEVERKHTLTFDEKVIKKIAGLSISDIPGILCMSGSFISGIADKFMNSDDPSKGITVDMANGRISVSMRIISEYGQNVPAIFQTIVDKITDSVKEMTGLDVTEVKVHVYDVLTKEDFERQRKRKAEESAENSETGGAEADAAAEPFGA